MPASLSFSTTTWNQGQIVTVSAAQDNDIGDGTATIGHSASGGGYNGVTGNVTATEDDDDTPAFSFTETSVTVPEGGSAQYSVSLAFEPTASVTVAVSRSSGDTDLTVNKSSLTFTTVNWNHGQEVTVSAAEDGDGLDGQATIAHSASGGGYGSVTGDVTAKESDNDRAISVTKTSVSVREGSTATYKVSLATQPSGTVTVSVVRSSGDSDLTVMPASLSFTTMNWNRGQEVTIAAAEDDDLADGSATIRHSVSGGSYDSVTRDVTATEDDDDTPALSFTETSVTVPEGGSAKYSVSLAFEPTASVTVAVARSSGDTDLTVNKSSLTFTTTNWNDGQEVTVSAVEDDDGTDSTATFTHTASGGGYGSVTGDVTATEDDNDTIRLAFSRTSFSVTEGGSAKYSVSLNTKPIATVTVAVARSSGDTDLTVNKSSLTFTTTTWNDGQEVTVSAAEDLDAINGQATIGHTASGGDYASITGDVTATESDNDTPGLTLSDTSLSVTEGRSAKYSVALATQPTATVTVSVSRSSGDADLTVNKSSLTFTTVNWFLPQEVTVSAAEDNDIVDGTATIGHSASGGDYGSVTGDVTANEDDNDSAALSFTSSSVTAPEGGNVMYSVSLSHRPSAEVRVALTRASGDMDLSVLPASLTFSTTNWKDGQEVTVSAAEDDDIADGSATIRHTAAAGGYGGVTGNVTATEDDNDSPALSFTATSVTVPEGSSATYSVSLAFRPTSTVAVVITRSSGDTDLTVMPPALTFTTSNWNRRQEVTVSAAADADLADGSATIRHTALGGGYDSVAADVTATENDDDTPALAFTEASVTVPEGGSAQYSISLTHKPSATVTVSISHSSGDSDLTVSSPSGGSLTFTTTNWNDAQDVTIQAAEDDDLTDGMAVIRHTAVGGGYNSVTGDVTATEDDNDSPSFTFTATSVEVAEGRTATYSVSLAVRPTGNVTLSVTRSSGDPDVSVMPSALTFTTMNWMDPQELTVSAAEDNDLADGSARISHTASGGGYAGTTESITAVEDDNDTPNLAFSDSSVTAPEGGSITYRVSLAYQPGATVAVAVGRASGDTDLTVSPAVLTFMTGNWNVPQQVTVLAAEDDDLTNGMAVIRHTAVGGGYNSVTGDVTAVEDDNDTPSLELSKNSFSVPEGFSATYTVSLTQKPSAAVTVSISRASGDSDLTVSSPSAGSLTFTTMNWNRGQEVTIAAAEDDDAVNGEATISHSASGGGYGAVTADVTAMESDNDAPGLTFSETELTVSEGETATYTLSLATQPSGTVTVSISRKSGDSDLSVMPASLTFTTMNWNDAQDVTIQAAEDDDAINGKAVFAHTASGADYASVARDTTATERDNDTTALVLTGTPLMVEEGETATYTVRLASRPTGTVTVSVSRKSGDSDLSVMPASLTFTTMNWNDAQELTVSAAEDEDGLNGEAVFLHTASGADYAGATAEAEAAEVDNDMAGLMLSTTSLELDENAGQDTYTVKLMTVPSGPVTVTIASRDPTTATPAPSSLRFTDADWDQPKPVTVTAVDDFIDSDRTTAITHQAAGPDYAGVTGPELEVILRDDDMAGVIIDPEELQIAEAGDGHYTLKLASEPTSPVVISISRLGDNVDNLDWAPKRLTFSAADWSRPQSVTVTSTHDQDALPGVALMRHTATSPDPVYSGIPIDDVEVLLGDDDQVVTSAVLTVSDEEIAEGEPSALVTVTATLDAVTTIDLSITLSVGGTATADDYTVGGTLAIEVEADQQTGQTTLTFAPVDDVVVEPTETIEISGSALGITVTGATLDLTDNDQRVTDAELSLSDEEIAEGETSALVTVTATLDAVTSGGLSIALSFGGTATPQDYSFGGNPTIEIQPGKTTGETVLTFAPIDDALVEGNETIIVNGASPGLTVSQATLILVDDDVAVGDAVGALSVDLDRVAESARDTLITVTLTLEDDFTFDEIRTFELQLRGTGNAAAVDFDPVQPRPINILSGSSVGRTTFVLRPENDLVDEIDETLTLSVVSSPLPVSPATIILVDDDTPPTGISLSVDDPDIAEGEATADITLTATVNGGTTFARAVNLALAFGGTATEGGEGDYTLTGFRSIEIPAGQRTGTTVLTFMPIDDPRDELNETIEISGTSPGIQVEPVSLLLIDNDESLLQLTAAPRRLREGDSPSTVNVTLTVRTGTPYDQPLDVVLELNGTARRTIDYNVTGPLRLQLPAGSLTGSASLTFAPIDDTLDEPEETIELIGNAGFGYTSTAVILLEDNDIPPARIFLSVTPNTLQEADPSNIGVTLTATVDGNTAFSTNTEVELELAGTAVPAVDYDVGGLADPLVIPAGRLTASREITIAPIDDTLPEGVESIIVSGTSVVRVVEAEISLIDDDGEDLRISFSRAEYDANEYGAPAQVVITVTPTADRPEAISLSVLLAGGAGPDDYAGVPDEVVFRPGDDSFTFSVEALPDDHYESGESIRLRLATLSSKVTLAPIPASTVRLIERRPLEEFSGELRTVLALSARAWSDSIQSTLEERFGRARQTEEWGGWQPDYQEPSPPLVTTLASTAFSSAPGHPDHIVPGDWLASWRRQNERRNMGVIQPRLSLSKLLAKIKGWRPVLWAEGNTHHFSGNLRALDYQGGFQAAHVGLDLHSGKTTLLGASLMRGRSLIDYSDGETLNGKTQATLYSVHPYLHVQANQRIALWALGGFATGPVTVRELDRDHELRSFGRLAGGGARFLAKRWERRELAVRTDGDLAWIGADLKEASATIGGLAGRLRLLAELTQTFGLFGQTLIATGETGARLDRGAAHRGDALEAAGRISWRKPEKGLDFSAHGQSLLWHQSSFRIWGAGIQAGWDPGAEKRGLVVRFASGRGPRGGKTRLFQEPVQQLLSPGDALTTELELGYGTGVGARVLTLTFRLRGLSGWTAAVDLR